MASSTVTSSTITAIKTLSASPISMSAPEIITLSKRKARKLDGWSYYIYKINRLAQKSLEFTLVYKNNNSLVYEWNDNVTVTRFLFTFRFKGDATRRECKFGYMSFGSEHMSKYPIHGFYDVLELDDAKLEELFECEKDRKSVEGLKDVYVVKKKTPRSLYKEFKSFVEDIYYDYNIDMYSGGNSLMSGYCDGDEVDGEYYDDEDEWFEEDYDY